MPHLLIFYLHVRLHRHLLPSLHPCSCSSCLPVALTLFPFILLNLLSIFGCVVSSHPIMIMFNVYLYSTNFLWQLFFHILTYVDSYMMDFYPVNYLYFEDNKMDQRNHDRLCLCFYLVLFFLILY